MKKVNTILVMILLMTGCGGSNRKSDNEAESFITVDVTKSYSKKKKLILQDFMDVEYIPLKATFRNQGFVLDIGKEILLVKNRNDDGNIFVYNRNGVALREINRKGRSNEEYAFISSIILDEDNGEMFVNDIYAERFVVYDLYGNFKRSFKHKDGSGSMHYTDIFNYDKGHLICYDEYNEEIAFVLISKLDGSITKEIKIPFKEKKAARAIRRDEVRDMANVVPPVPNRPIIPFNGNWILSEVSSDSVYAFFPDCSMRPVIVRTPSVQSMNPGVFLMLRLFSDRYYFMETIRNVYDFDTRKGFPRTFFMYDKQEQAFSGYKVYNGDYSTKKEINMTVLRPVNQEIESWQSLNADQLIEDYEKGILKGRLKDIAAKLDEESNPVIMLVKHKK